jgi:hypothetical protein
MAKLTSDGGKSIKRDLQYSEPQGPTTLYHSGPGLGGTNIGKSGTQSGGGGSTSGSPGLGGEVNRTGGQQGKH